MQDTLTWRAPTIAPQQLDTLIAFSFGNRLQPNGNSEPGPTNEALAKALVSVHRIKPVHVYAQWEVAEAVGDLIPEATISSIYPRRGNNAEMIYLSTDGVLAAIVTDAGPAHVLGKVGIIAFSDHQFRCVTTARRRGLDAYAPADIAMPSTYDPESGQPWCRTRMAYLLHDIGERISARRAEAIGMG
ncbi:MAG TPA: hypothetical protein VKQ27_09855 [Acetobacteraceae bacterium]|nr:hypothetical protein [Acetobacteraceae bacterium]